MKGRVHYVSPKGSAEMVAEAIAREVKCVKEPLLPAYMPEGVVLMFLGCEGTKADKTTMEFISSMNSSRVQHAALFAANPKKSTAAIEQMKKALTERGVDVLAETFVCQGKGMFGKHPTDADLEAARKWAAACEKKVLSD